MHGHARFGWVAVVAALFAGGTGAAGCTADPPSLNACENVAFKMRLCEVSEPPGQARSIDVCGGAITSDERCVIECWYDAECVDWVQSEPSPDVKRCLSNCGDYEFDCGDGITLAPSLICDGDPQCPDESDELNCD